jgi:hypothetical protein
MDDLPPSTSLQIIVEETKTSRKIEDLNLWKTYQALYSLANCCITTLPIFQDGGTENFQYW